MSWMNTLKASGLGFAVLLGAAQAAPLPRKEVRFSDVPRDHWAYEGVQVCAELGIFEGFDGYEVRPRFKVRDLSPAEKAALRLRALAEASVPASVSPRGLRPQLLDPLAEEYAQAFERAAELQKEAARIQLPKPPPEGLRRQKVRK